LRSIKEVRKNNFQGRSKSQILKQSDFNRHLISSILQMNKNLLEVLKVQKTAKKDSVLRRNSQYQVTLKDNKTKIQKSIC